MFVNTCLTFPAIQMRLKNVVSSLVSSLGQLWRRVGWIAIALSLFCWSGWATPAFAETTNNPDRSIQPYLERVSESISEFRLDNGMKFILMERHQAPVISFVTYANVGGVNEPEGKTGVAHFLEHLAFKGTQKIGTENYQAEKPLLEKLDRIAKRLQAAKAAGDTQKVEQLQQAFQKAQQKANSYVKQNEFGQIVEKYGGVGLNAATSADATRYFYNFPANKLELWMSLESERFLEPVFREFYQEKQVILEERRLRTDNSPVGKLIEEFLETAFQEHPYGQPVIGYPEDLRSLTREDVRDFFQTYYVPSNLIVGIVGDIDPKQVKELAQTYFGRYPSQPEPPKVTTVEPPQEEPREVTLRLPSQPWYLEGYHRPALDHPDSTIYDAIAGILSGGRTSRLYKSLVEEKQVALNAQGFNGFPGDRFANIMLFYGRTAPDRSVEELANALHGEIERLKAEPVTSEELERVKAQSRASLLRRLDSNQGMANLLLEYEAKTGDWRNLFSELEAIEQVTAEDIMRVAKETFQPDNRTVGKILPEES
jgi:predicted Zn-dependent peptidase